MKPPTHTHTHTLACACTFYMHTHSLKANSSETREDRPLSEQVTEWITHRAKTLASCLTHQRRMAFRWISLNLEQTVSQYPGNGQSLRKNNSQVIWAENVCLGHFAPQSCQPAITSVAHSQWAPFTQPDCTTAHRYLSIPEPLICADTAYSSSETAAGG